MEEAVPEGCEGGEVDWGDYDSWGGSVSGLGIVGRRVLTYGGARRR